MQGDQLLDALEDREQTSLRTLLGRRAPPPVANGGDLRAVYVDDPVPACSRPWIDAENSHEDTLGTGPDVSFPPRRIERAEPSGLAGDRFQHLLGDVEVGVDVLDVVVVLERVDQAHHLPRLRFVLDGDGHLRNEHQLR